MGGEAGSPPFEAVESARERRTFLSVNFVERVYTHYPWDVSNGHLNEPADRVGRVDDVAVLRAASRRCGSSVLRSGDAPAPPWSRCAGARRRPLRPLASNENMPFL